MPKSQPKQPSPAEIMTIIARQLGDYMRDQSPVTIDLNATRYETRQQVSKALRALVIAREAELCQRSR